MASRNMIILVLGLVLIGAGFVSLSRGSITLAPILLVAGYCVAIPVGIMVGAPGFGRQAQRVRREGE
ncbi:MAG: hypothetical protein ABIG03_03860 [Candidatus Eisenbacteria bacterium]